MNQLYVLFTISLIAFCGITFIKSDVSHLGAKANEPVPVDPKPVTDICLGCICEAVSGCNRTLNCNGDVCGLFRITWAYWSDSGKPTLNGEAPGSQTAYSNCVNDPYCAASAVQGYMSRFGQDCNTDGVINCIDHAAIHILGGYGCKGDLPYKYKTTFDQCLEHVLKS